MDFSKIVRMIKENEVEIANINEKRTIYSRYSDVACQDRRDFLEDQNVKLREILEFCKSSAKKVNGLLASKNGDNKHDTKIDQEIAKIEKAVNKHKSSLKLNGQGKFRNMVSTIFGQLDKRIHNKIYNGNPKAEERFKDHKTRIENRYKWSGLLRYVGIRAAIGAIAFIPGVKLGLGAAYTVLAVANSAFIANTVVRAVSTVYNKLRYGGPLIEQRKKIYGGTYLEKLENASFEMTRAGETNKKFIINRSIINNNNVNSNQNNHLNENNNKNEDNHQRTNENQRRQVDDKIRILNEKIRNFTITPSTTLQELKAIELDASQLYNGGNLNSELVNKYREIRLEIQKRQVNDKIRILNEKIRNFTITSSTTLQELKAIELDANQLYNSGNMDSDIIEKYDQISLEIQKRETTESNNNKDVLSMIFDDLTTIKQSTGKKDKTAAIKKFLIDIGGVEQTLPKVKLAQFDKYQDDLFNLSNKVASGDKLTEQDINRLAEIIYNLQDKLSDKKERLQLLQTRVLNNTASEDEKIELYKLQGKLRYKDKYDYNDYVADLAADYVEENQRRRK